MSSPLLDDLECDPNARIAALQDGLMSVPSLPELTRPLGPPRTLRVNDISPSKISPCTKAPPFESFLDRRESISSSHSSSSQRLRQDFYGERRFSRDDSLAETSSSRPSTVTRHNNARIPVAPYTKGPRRTRSSEAENAPSADVVPFLYQDFEDIKRSGDAPVRQAPISKNIPMVDSSDSSSSHVKEKLHKKTIFEKILGKKREVSPSGARNTQDSSKQTLDSSGFFGKNALSSQSKTVHHSPSLPSLRLHKHKKDENVNDKRFGIVATKRFALDTDLDSMAGIVGPSALKKAASNQLDNDPVWNAPESWAILKADSTHDDAVDEQPEPQEKPSTRKMSSNYCVRIFRDDSTFATISCGLHTTTAELKIILGKKFFATNLASYHILLKRNGLTRILRGNERPLLIQRKLLEQVGYTEADRIEELGRDDHSYLCRFIFASTSLPLFNIQEDASNGNFEHVDLQGQNLETIPVSLFRHAAEVVSLNISKNLSLELPSDILQSCINLKELRFAYNEAKRLMSNLPLAQKLTHLDVSNNRLEDLSNANLHKIETLVSLKLQNNKLVSLPEPLATLTHLRSLNISTNNFKEFPLAICGMESLIDLDVSFNKLESLPEQIGNLLALDRLIANNNKFQGSFPESMKNMESLRELDIRFNFFTNIEILAQIPNLEVAYCGNNSATTFEPKLLRLKVLNISKNPITQFSIGHSTQNLVVLTLMSAKLAVIPPGAFDNMINLERLVLDNNQLSTIPSEVGNLKHLQYFSCIKNLLSSLPSEIGRLTKLKFLDVHNNNLKFLPTEIWQLTSLGYLNASSNLLSSFPVPPPQGSLSSAPVDEPNGTRKESANSRTNVTMAATLRTLLLGDNRFTDDVFQELSVLTELRVLNLSFNEIIEVPPSALGRLQNLVELYLSGNELNSLPAEDFERISTLRILHINANKLQTLPAELGKIRRLLVLDVGCNSLKYNINNWPYDWNWNWNLDLVYLNMSGNKKLEIRPSISVNPAARERNLSDFSALTKLRVLGLMDVTLMVSSPPDQTEDRRVRTTSSEVHNMSYGMADYLGHNEHLSLIDLVVPRFRGKEDEAIFGLFDGQISSTSGNKISHFLQESFTTYLSNELSRLRKDEGTADALRRAFLNINREMGLAAGAGFNSKKTSQPLYKQRPSLISMLGPETLTSGASALVIYLAGKTMYIANAGDAVALLSKTDGEAKLLSEKHHAALEIDRIREAGGVVSRDGKINDILELSRAIGYFHLVPIVQAAPCITEITLSTQDEFVILGNRELWEYISYQTAVDIARTEREDLMLAAQKLRDFAIAYGASSKIMVMIIGVGDLFHRKSKPRMRNASAPRGLSGSSAVEEEFILKRKRGKAELPADSDLARLEREVPPPVGELAMVFTDIKNSTVLWETNYIAMRSAIKIHNSLMRRQLRIIGGYEVKTEGDAFMVAFPTTFAAMLWCFTVQTQLLLADWPQEILDTPQGKEVFDPVTGNLIYRGISVRMGIHYGSPVCEPDPITRRMDYFGPMVNRASRISAVADGGQITISSDAVCEIKALESLLDNETDDINEEEFGDEILLASTRRDMGMLKKMGFGLMPIGERKLKGLENPEFISLVYPKALSGRLDMDLSSVSKPVVPAGPEQVFESEHRTLDVKDVRLLGQLCLRLERLSSQLPAPGSAQSKMELLTGPLVIKVQEDEDDLVLIKVLENFVIRIENCISTIFLRRLAEANYDFTDANLVEILNKLKFYLSSGTTS